MARPSLRHQLLISGSLVVVCAAVFGFAIRSTLAGALPSSLSPNVSMKAAIYQGVVAIAPTSATVLELGNAGRDIAGSSDLYLRPNGLVEAQGAHIVASGTVSDLYVASLCLYGTGSEVCQSGVPSGGSDTFWSATIQSGSFEYLTPNTAGRGVQLGSIAAPVLGKALEINTNNVAPAISITGDMITGSFNDADFSPIGSGNVTVSGRVQITNSAFSFDTLRVAFHIDTDNYATPWSQLYQGRFTRLDADTFDGTTSVNFSNVAKKDIFWKEFIASQTKNYQTLCVHTESPSLCSTSSGALAGKICTVNAECGSGTCVRLCQTQPDECPTTTTRLVSYNLPVSTCTLVTGDGGCNDYCTAAGAPILCDGSIAPPATTCPSSTIGSIVRSNVGTFVHCSGGSPVTVQCSCGLIPTQGGVPRKYPYQKNIGYGGGDLCSQLLVL